MSNESLAPVFYVASNGEAYYVLPRDNSLTKDAAAHYVLTISDNPETSPLWRNRLIRQFLAAKAGDVGAMELSMESHGAVLLGPLTWEGAIFKGGEIRTDARKFGYTFPMSLGML